MTTKRIAVLHTIIQGRKQYLARHLRQSTLDRTLKVATYTPQLTGAMEFSNEVEAEAFIQKIANIAGRALVASTEVVNVENQKEKRAMKETLR